MRCFIGLDLGTSAVKGALMAENGKILCVYSQKFHYFGENGQRLMDPEDYCAVIASVIRHLADAAGSENTIAAICSCCASGNLLLLDGDYHPITPIIGWQTSVPAEDYLPDFTEEEKQWFYETVGWPLCSCYAPAWLLSMRKHNPAYLQNAKGVVMSAEYLNYKLCGKWGLSHSMGTPFYLIDQVSGTYSPRLLAKLGIADKFLPPIYPKGTVLGNVLPAVAKDLHVSPDTVIVLGSFDHPSGATGAGVYEEGEMLLSCGTSWVEFFPVSSREKAIATRGLVDRFMLDGSPYCVMKSLSSIDPKMARLREMYFGDMGFKEFDALAESGEPGCGGLRFTFEETEPTARPQYTDKQIARAIVESAALLLRENLEQLKKCGLHADRITAIGGITNSPQCVSIISQILGKEVSVVNGQSAGAVGSCMLGAIGVGVFENEKTAFRCMLAANN